MQKALRKSLKSTHPKKKIVQSYFRRVSGEADICSKGLAILQNKQVFISTDKI